MAVVPFNSNMASLAALRGLERADKKVASVFERLSSGQRINRSSDDAAGLAIASSLNVQSRVYNQALRNGNDAISMLNVADGALNSIEGILIRLKELDAQAANGTFTLQQRGALDSEAYSLTNEFNRIVGSTTFNGRLVIHNAGERFSIQLGFGTDALLSFDLSQELARQVGTGGYTHSGSDFLSADATTIEHFDIDGDGNIDLIGGGFEANTAVIQYGRGDGTFAPEVQLGNLGSTVQNFQFADVNGDGRTDIIVRTNSSLRVLSNNGNRSFSVIDTMSPASSATQNTFGLGDFDSDGDLDIVIGYSTVVPDNVGGYQLYANNGSGDFSLAAQVTLEADFQGAVNKIVVADFNSDGRLDFAGPSGASQSLKIFLGQGDGTFQTPASYSLAAAPQSLATADINHDGYSDIVVSGSNQTTIFLGSASGSFSMGQTLSVGNTRVRVEDINGDGVKDIVTAGSGNYIHTFWGTGDGTFGGSISYQPVSGGTFKDFALGDYNNDGVQDLTAAISSTLRYNNPVLATVSTIQRFNLLTQQSALAEMAPLDQALERVVRQRGAIGAVQSRIESALNNLRTSTMNISAARDRIVSADIAEESSALIRFRILQQTASAVLAQANLQPQLVLTLLGAR